MIQSAKGGRPCDLLLANGRIVDVLSGELIAASVAIAGGCIAGAGEYPAVRSPPWAEVFLWPAPMGGSGDLP